MCKNKLSVHEVVPLPMLLCLVSSSTLMENVLYSIAFVTDIVKRAGDWHWLRIECNNWLSSCREHTLHTFSNYLRGAEVRAEFRLVYGQKRPTEHESLGAELSKQNQCTSVFNRIDVWNSAFRLNVVKECPRRRTMAVIPRIWRGTWSDRLKKFQYVSRQNLLRISNLFNYEDFLPPWRPRKCLMQVWWLGLYLKNAIRI